MIFYEFFRRYFRYLKVKNAKKKADKMKAEHKVTYYVYQIHKKLYVLNDFQINEMIKRKILSPALNCARKRRKYAIYMS